MDLAGKRVLVTGGHGFLGRHVVARLHEAGAHVDAPTHRFADLLDQQTCNEIVEIYPPQIVIHLAAKVGGIEYNRQRPATVLYNNAVMALNMLDACVGRESAGIKVEKFIGIGSVCEYPAHCPTPFTEPDIWNGYPEVSNGSYGIAKRLMLEYGQACRAQHGLNAIHLLLANLYGPGDNFADDSGHVVAAMIRKFDAAKERGDSEVVLWGTGDPTRDFLYVEDAADGIVAAAERYDSAEPMNIARGDPITIFVLSEQIAALVGFHGSIRWDASKPDGQIRRHVSPDYAKRAMQWRATTTLAAGLERTVEWYRANKGQTFTI